MKPPQGKIVDGRQCTRCIGGVLGGEEVLCGKPATTHMLWTPDLDNGMACDEHKDDFEAWRTHPLGGCCGMPNTVYSDELNICRYDDSAPPETFHGMNVVVDPGVPDDAFAVVSAAAGGGG